jgi:hypothetical protein
MCNPLRQIKTLWYQFLEMVETCEVNEIIHQTRDGIVHRTIETPNEDIPLELMAPAIFKIYSNGKGIYPTPPLTEHLQTPDITEEGKIVWRY